jgi:subtilisin family serine protease
MKAATALLVAALMVCAAALAPVDDKIERTLAKGERLDILVYGPERQALPSSHYKGMTRAERREAVHDAHIRHNMPFQEPIRKLASAAGFSIKPFWIGNVVLVKQASAALVDKLRGMQNVVRLEAVKDVAHLVQPMVNSVEDETEAKTRRAQWNIEIINAPSAWAITRGEDITLSNVDTGVRYTHVAVVGSYRGNNNGVFNHDYNWLDPSGAVVPFDNNGHGTHTMGTIVGSESSGVGVAPGAKWIAAKGCAASSCSNAHLIESMQYVLCPTTQDGSQTNCTKGADVMSNSWGGGQGSTTFKAYIEAWLEAGSIPIFSQGNAGPTCGSANSPGDLGIVIGVGSTSRTDALSSFSSRGPGQGTADFPLLKPEISAPGEAVYSSYHTSDTAYATLSGTSMACPHVTGLVGLMLSVNPALDYDQVLNILASTAVKSLPAPSGVVTTCSGIPYTTYPNYFYGHGRIDAYAAVRSAFASK